MDMYRLPAEWEPQSAVQLTWPTPLSDWRDNIREINATYVEMATAIARYEKVLIVASAMCSIPTSLRRNKNVRMVREEYNDTWARDHAFISLVGDGEKPRLLNFKFNGWGMKFNYHLDNALNLSLWQDLGLKKNCSLGLNSDFVLEGGSIESDGCGTVFTTSQCLLAPNRNQPLTQKQIEIQLMLRLHARRIVWLDHGNLLGDDTDGHIDTIVRTAPDDTLLYIRCNNKRDPQHDDFQRLEKQLEELRTLDGKPYRLLPLPMPRALYDDDGERMPATYANFLVINGAVLVPTYNQTDNDQAAMRTIATAFPGRDIIGIDARQIIRQHGSIHCCTMQYPAGVF